MIRPLSSGYRALRIALLIGSAIIGMSLDGSQGVARASGRPSVEALPGDSLFQLPIRLETAEGKTLHLADLRGHPLLVTMFYARCASVCPLLTARLQRFVEELPPAERDALAILMVSFDAAQDTAEVLRAFKSQHHIEDSRWVVARTSAHDTRALAAALGIRYRELPDHSFEHSAMILLTDRDGVIRARTSDLSEPETSFLQAVHAQLHKEP